MLLLPRAACSLLPQPARDRGDGGDCVPARRHLDGAVQVALCHGLAAAFEMEWATAATKEELMLLNWGGDLLGA